MRATRRLQALGLAASIAAGVAVSLAQDESGSASDLSKQVHEVLEGAVKLSLASQTSKGGWGYSFAGERLYGLDEASTTITQIQGLRAARNAGISVPSKAISRAVEYVRQCMND